MVDKILRDGRLVAEEILLGGHICVRGNSKRK